jgi:invasion protein IalB
MICLAWPNALAAQDPQTTRHRDWQVVRDGNGGCLAATTAGLAAGKTGLLTLSLLPLPDQTGARTAGALMSARVPLGVSLTEPLAYSRAQTSEAVGLAWQRCDAETCLAMAPISAEELARLKRGRRVLFAFRPLRGSKPLIVPVSLMGLTRAWGAVTDCP